MSVYGKLDPRKRDSCFEVIFLILKVNFGKIYGLDFMIDANFKPWLIEVNTNPCLETNYPLL